MRERLGTSAVVRGRRSRVVQEALDDGVGLAGISHSFGELVADDVGVHAQGDRGVSVAEPGGSDRYGTLARVAVWM
jgi:hypothetical protein